VTLSKKPNLLFIFTDQQRADTMACYGNDDIQTPNLNALADQSFVFENAYVSQPVCTPSRTTIMTGLYPHTSGCTSNNIPLSRNAKTIAEMVSGDYRTGYYGKWHLGNELHPQHGFDEWVSIEDLYRPYYSDAADLGSFSDYHHFLVSQGYEPDVVGEATLAKEYGKHDARARFSDEQMVFSRPFAAQLLEEHTKASYLGRATERFIRESADDDRPFMLYANFFEPHPPFVGPLDGLHSRDKLNTGPAFLQTPGEDMSVLHRMMADYYKNATEEGVDLSTDKGWREIRARYFGLVTLVDKAIGGIMQALEDSGQADDTIVVYTSEHGDMMGDHAILHKTMMYEEAMRVPLLIRVPWLSREQQTIGGRVGLIDAVPTLLDLLGENVPTELQGESLVPVLQGDADLSENDVVVQWNGDDGRKNEPFDTDIPAEDIEAASAMPRRVIISHEGLKLHLSPGDQCELYDLNDDPHELVNLYNDEEHRHSIRELASRLRLWQEKYKDYTPVLPDEWDSV
jgi:arylsulfatase A-like enzyme